VADWFRRTAAGGERPRGNCGEAGGRADRVAREPREQPLGANSRAEQVGVADNDCRQLRVQRFGLAAELGTRNIDHRLVQFGDGAVFVFRLGQYQAAHRPRKRDHLDRTTFRLDHVSAQRARDRDAVGAGAGRAATGLSRGSEA